MMKVRYIAIGVIVIVAIVVGVCLILVSTDTSEDASDTPSDVTLIDFQYEKPEWLEGHLKQGSIEEYIKKRKKEITDDAIDLSQEFPNSSLLPFTLDITLDRTVLDEYESILIAERADTGGAHGNMQYIHYNLHNGNSITLADYLKNRGTSEIQLLMLINERLRQDEYELIENFEDVPWQVHTWTNEQSIGIRILFPPYAVGPFSAGTITYTF
jgi:hypothetical protein